MSGGPAIREGLALARLTVGTAATWTAHDLAELGSSLGNAASRLQTLHEPVVPPYRPGDPRPATNLTSDQEAIWRDANAPLSRMEEAAWDVWPRGPFYLEPDRWPPRPESGLRVVRIEMSSPGLFSFEGLGEVVRELRLIIERLLRCGHERRMMRLEELERILRLEERRLSLEQRYGRGALRDVMPDFHHRFADAQHTLGVRLKSDLTGVYTLALEGKVDSVESNESA